jgi:chitodextrinase
VVGLRKAFGGNSRWIVLLGGAALLGACPLFAIQLTVYNTNDVGAGSLRQAIQDNAALGGGNTVVFSNVVTGTITLTSGELLITNNVTILGPTTSLAVSGNNLSRVFRITTGAVTIVSLTISNGRTTGAAGANGTALHPNGFAGAAGQGGGVFNGGTLVMSNCTFAGNAAIGGRGGDGLGIAGDGGAGGPADGAALYNQGTGMLVNCTFSGNFSTGGNGGVGSTTGGTGGNADGGCVFNRATLTLVHCTLSANSVAGGNGGSAEADGGNGGDGRGGGLFHDAGSSSTIQNTIVAGNSVTGGAGEIGGATDGANGSGLGPDVFSSGAVGSQGYNLIGNAANSSGFGATADQINVNPLLGPLADYGGPTPTMALKAGSPAIDKSNSFGLTTDQRGEPRYDDPNISNASGGDGSDIGAYEAAELRITAAVKIGNHLRMDFTSMLGTNYQVESRSDFASGAWTALPGSIAGNGGLASAIVSNAFSELQQFYRIHLAPATAFLGFEAPTVPSGLVVTAVSPTQISLTWENSSDTGWFGLGGYVVYRDGVEVGTVPSTSYTDAVVAAASAHCYSVAAFDNAANLSATSAVICASTPCSGEEFVGPFPSWADLKRDYSAVGDGIADDTAALQRALSDLGQGTNATVLFIPAGTYSVTQPLLLQSRIHVAIIGEHPVSTRLIWNGLSGGTLLHLDGVAYSKLDRIAFDGNNRGSVGVDQSLTGYGQGQYFDTGNEYADDVFTGFTYGIQGGAYGLGAAESAVLRCKFIGNSQAGIILKNYNALDWFLWYCTFDNNRVGVSNYPDAGAFHVFGCLFRGSTLADLRIGTTGIFSFRNNTSIGSGKFLLAQWMWTNAAQLTLQGNSIVDVTNTNDLAIDIGNMGPVTLLDNVIASHGGANNPAVSVWSYDGPDLIAVGNTFTVNSPIAAAGQLSPARRVELNTQVVPRGQLDVSTPTLPQVPPKFAREIYEVRPGASAAEIQGALVWAAQRSGNRPVVHLPPGQYNVSRTVLVPVNCDVQIIGDGGQTILNWTGDTAGPVLQFAGPSRAVARDFRVLAGGTTEGVQISGADQSGSRIYMQQVHAVNCAQINLLVDGLDNTSVELQNFYHSDARSGTSVKVVGGPQSASGDLPAGRTTVFAGASSNNALNYEVFNGGRLMVQDVWYEGSVNSKLTRLTGKGWFTGQGLRIALPRVGSCIDISGFDGKATILNSQADDNISVSGSGLGTVWVAGNEGHTSSSDYFLNSSSLRAVFTNNRWYDPSWGSRQTANQGAWDSTLILNMLAQLRQEKPTADPIPLADGLTDARLYRVLIYNCSIGLHLKP